MNITAYDWQGMLGAVVSKKADVAFSGISITEPRKKVMDFSKPYMDNTWNLVSMKDRNIKLDNLDTLKNYSIGFPRGMAYMDFIKTELEPKGIYKTDQVKLYPSYNEALTDLQNGQVDLVFLDGTVASVYRKKLPVQDSYVFEGIDTPRLRFPQGLGTARRLRQISRRAGAGKAPGDHRQVDEIGSAVEPRDVLRHPADAA